MKPHSSGRDACCDECNELCQHEFRRDQSSAMWEHGVLPKCGINWRQLIWPTIDGTMTAPTVLAATVTTPTTSETSGRTGSHAPDGNVNATAPLATVMNIATTATSGPVANMETNGAAATTAAIGIRATEAPTGADANPATGAAVRVANADSGIGRKTKCAPGSAMKKPSTDAKPITA